MRQSANEHLVPEMMFDNPDTDEKEVEAISAVKAINIAVENGQTIYTITKDNYNEVLPLLNHNAQVMEDIRNAVNSGKEVTTHQSTLSYSKWTGSGYIILDKQTGTGAYLISGGANGSMSIPQSNNSSSFLLGMSLASIIGANITAYFAVGILATTSFILPLVMLIASFVIFVSLAIAMSSTMEMTEFNSHCFLQGLLTGLITGTILRFFPSVFLLWFNNFLRWDLSPYNNSCVVGN